MMTRNREIACKRRSSIGGAYDNLLLAIANGSSGQKMDVAPA